MSDTPRTDEHLSHLNLPDGNKIGIPIETVALLRQLERELTQAQAKCAELEKALRYSREVIIERADEDHPDAYEPLTIIDAILKEPR